MRSAKTLMIGFILATLPLRTMAQNFSVAVRVGTGTYAMNGLREFQRTIQQELDDNNIPAKKIRSFAPSINYQIQACRAFGPDYEFGVLFGRGTANGRVYYGDPSGSITSDQIVCGTNIGLMLENVFQRNGDWEWRQTLQVTGVFTTLKLEERFRYTGGETRQTLHVESWGIGVESGASVVRAINSRISLKLNLGFYFNISEGFHLKGEPLAVLLDRNENKVRPDWVGVRGGAALRFKIH